MSNISVYLVAKVLYYTCICDVESETISMDRQITLKSRFTTQLLGVVGSRLLAFKLQMFGL